MIVFVVNEKEIQCELTNTILEAKKEIIKQKISTGRNKSFIDQVSAALILQSYLDKKKNFSR